MRFVLLQTFLGLILSAFGIQVMHVYVSGLDNGASILLLVLALTLIGVGIYFLMKAGKSDATVFTRLKNFRKKKIDDSTTLAQVLEKNNQLTQDWDKTIEKRDKLKMLEISTAAAADAGD